MIYREEHTIPAEHIPQLPEGVTVRLYIMPEDQDVAGSFASGDEDEDAATVAEVYRRLESSLWAWCVVCVEVTDGDAIGTDYLGGCSYWTDSGMDRDAVASFFEGYGPQMITNALDEYTKDAERLAAKYSHTSN